MSKLFLKHPTEITTLEGKTILLTNPVYNLSDDKLAIKNEFYKCPKCKNFFDEVCTNGTIPVDQQRWYCETCFDKL